MGASYPVIGGATMAAQVLEIDLRSIGKLKRFLAKAGIGAKVLRYAESVFLNNVAFGLRKTAEKEIEQSFTLRRPTFVKGRLRVAKADRSNLAAFFGPVEDRPGFTSLVEQETGEKVDRKHVATIAGRKGSKSKVIPSMHRLKSGAKYRHSKKYTKVMGARNRASAMLHHLSRINWKKPFVLKDHANMPYGLYRFGSGTKYKRKIILLQEIDSPNVQPRRERWLTNTGVRARVLTSRGMTDAWARAVRYSQFGRSRSF